MSRRGGRAWVEPELCLGCRCSQRGARHGAWLCDACWRVLPGGQRAAIIAAREEKAAHRLSAALRRAAAWIREQGPAAQIARVTGDYEGAVADGQR